MLEVMQSDNRTGLGVDTRPICPIRSFTCVTLYQEFHLWVETPLICEMQLMFPGWYMEMWPLHLMFSGDRSGV